MMNELSLNTVSSIREKYRKRVGRGIGSGSGKTAGRGHKGQRARSGGRRDGVFEGGQMPLYRRLPKRGFNSRLMRQTTKIRLQSLEKLSINGELVTEVTMKTLREAGLLPHTAKRARIYLSGELSRAVTIQGVPVTVGAKEKIEKAGGKIVVDVRSS